MNATANIVLYGATGKLGVMVAQELTNLGSPFIASGRDGMKLGKLAQRLAIPRTQIADLSQPDSIKNLLQDSTVLINCASPAIECGRPLVEAALATGTHYLDAYGEQWFIKELFDTYQAKAQQNNIAIIGGMGLDYAIGDCLAHLVAADGSDSDSAELVIAYAFTDPQVGSNNTAQVSTQPSVPEVIFRSGEWRQVPWGLDWATFTFPEPLGRQQMARYAAGEVITVPRHTPVSNIKALITARSLVPHPSLLPVFPLLRPLVTVLRRTRIRHLLRVPTPLKAQPRESTSEDFVVAVSIREAGASTRMAVARGSGYYSTSARILAVAATLAGSPSFNRTGTLSAATAFDPKTFLTHLPITWHID